MTVFTWALPDTLTNHGVHMTELVLQFLTDYLYRVESKQPGTEGGGKSPWLAVRSGEGGEDFC